MRRASTSPSPCCGTLISAIVGTLIGALVGYYQEMRGLRSFAAGLIMRSADVLQAFPVFVFAIALVAIFGQSLQSIIASIAFVNIPIYLRLMRSQVLSIRHMRYIEAAYVAGRSGPRDPRSATSSPTPWRRC